MNEGKLAKKPLRELADVIGRSRPVIRKDYVVGLYRVWTRLPALERVMIRKGVLKQDEVDREMAKDLKRALKDFQ